MILEYIRLILTPLTVILMIVFGFLKLKHAITRDKYNLLLSVFFFMIASSLIINLYYILNRSSLSDEDYKFLVRLTGLLYAFIPCIPLIFVGGLLISFKTYTKFRIMLILTAAFLLSLPIMFVGDVWRVEELERHFIDSVLGIYIMVVTTVYFISFFVLSKVMLDLIKTPKIKMRYIQFALGYLSLLSLIYFIILMNMDIISAETLALSNSFLSLFSTIMLYLGIGRRLKD